MAKYNWKQLEKDYILSDYRTVSAFLKDKGIDNNAYIRRATKGWKEKKSQHDNKKVTKIIEKVTEKQSEKEAQQIVDLKTIANDLALNVIKANNQLQTYIVKNKKKTKTVKYDYRSMKPKEEKTEENEIIETMDGIIDRQGLKMLASALKDLNDILTDKQGNSEKDLDNAKEILVKIKEVANNDRRS